MTISTTKKTTLPMLAAASLWMLAGCAPSAPAPEETVAELGTAQLKLDDETRAAAALKVAARVADTGQLGGETTVKVHETSSIDLSLRPGTYLLDVQAFADAEARVLLSARSAKLKVASKLTAKVDVKIRLEASGAVGVGLSGPDVDCDDGVGATGGVTVGGGASASGMAGGGATAGGNASASGAGGSTGASAGAGASATGGSTGASAGGMATATGGSTGASAGAGASATGGSTGASAGGMVSATGGSTGASAGAGASATGGSAGASAGGMVSVTGGSTGASAGAGASATGGSAGASAGGMVSVTGGSTGASAGAGASATGGSTGASAGAMAAASVPVVEKVDVAFGATKVKIAVKASATAGGKLTFVWSGAGFVGSVAGGAEVDLDVQAILAASTKTTKVLVQSEDGLAAQVHVSFDVATKLLNVLELKGTCRTAIVAAAALAVSAKACVDVHAQCTASCKASAAASTSSVEAHAACMLDCAVKLATCCQ